MLQLYIQTKDLESSNPLKQTYIKIKKSFRERVRSAKATDVLRRFPNSKNQEKAMWDVVNENIPWKGAKPFTPLSIINNKKGELLHDPKLVFDCLNEYFIQVGQAGNNCSSNPSLGNRNLTRNFYLFLTDEEEVLNVVKSLKTTYSSGKDGISSKVLKECVYMSLQCLLLTSKTHRLNVVNSLHCSRLPKKKNATHPELHLFFFCCNLF